VTDSEQPITECYCLAIRQAARHVSQFYDRALAPAGLRGTQFAILSRLLRLGPMTINELAAILVMDRTTLGRNILPLQREALIAVQRGRTDRRSKELRITEKGADRVRAAAALWREAQLRFETVFGNEESARLRGLMQHIAAADLSPREPDPKSEKTVAA